MTSWKKKVRPVDIKQRYHEKESNYNHSSSGNNGTWLPQYYYGSVDRLNRYNQYDYMDFDVDVNMALDKTAEFCTLLDPTSNLPFELLLNDNIANSEQKIISNMLSKWVKHNNLNAKIFNIFRNSLKYGDCIFIRDPDTLELYWIDPYNVSYVIANEETKEIEFYMIKDLDFNLQSKIGSKLTDEIVNIIGNPVSGQRNNVIGMPSKNTFADNQYKEFSNKTDINEYPVSAEHVVHISMNNGMDALWPFGRSILDTVFKPFRQKELMEDAIIIYRVQRSPERLMFKIDTGDMNPKKADAYVKEVAKEFKQRRKPVIDRTNGETVMDTTYNPMSMNEDFYFAQNQDGRSSTVEVLPGGECLDLDTEIMLIDGSKPTLRECIDRYKQGEQLWTFSINPSTNVIIPAMVSWAGITREDSEMTQLVFSDGTTVNVTPDHKFPIKNRGLVEAQDINIGDEFYHVNTQYEEHNMYYNTKSKAWERVMDMFDDYFKQSPMTLTYRELFRDNPVQTKDVESITLKAAVPLPNNMCGTLTIDGNEYFSKNHNFSLANGVITQNSTGSIEDLKFFSSRLIRSLNVPISYMSYLTEDGQTYTYNDGKNGTAYMEEFSFSEYCKRLQRQIIPSLDTEFKLFVKQRGVQISSSDFEIKLIPPQSFSEYRQIELDTAQLGVFQSVADVGYLSKRFILKRFLNLTDDEIKENERLFQEENKQDIDITKAVSSLKDGNVTSPTDSDIDDLEDDEDSFFDDGDDEEI